MPPPELADLERLFHESHRRWLRFLDRWLGDAHRAEDVLQETWLLAWEGGVPAPCDCADGGLEIGKLALRLASRERRRKRKEKWESLEGEAASERDGCPAFQVAGRRWYAEELLLPLREELARLDEAEGRLLRRHYEDCRPSAQLARETGLTRAAVHSRLRRSRERLRCALERRLLEAAQRESTRHLPPESPGAGGAKEW